MSDATRFVGLGFCATFVNADPYTVAELGVYRTLAAQAAYGMNPAPDHDALFGWINRCEHAGLDVAAWGWCDATNIGDARSEGRYHAEQLTDLELELWIADAEERYDAHGDQWSPRWNMLNAYVDAFMGRLAELGVRAAALAVTTTPRFASSYARAQDYDWLHMPQAFQADVADATVANTVEFSHAWGWTTSRIRPLVQTYPSPDGTRPAADPYLADSAACNVGISPYTVEQALDPEGCQLIAQLEPAILRAPAPNGGAPVNGTIIGNQDGIVAATNRLRDLDPAGTLLKKAGGKWPSLGTLTVPLDQWKAYDKLERTLTILVDDHDQAIG